MIAAIMPPERGCRVSLWEKTENWEKTVYHTEKGRCNVTNACDMEELFAYGLLNRKFCSAVLQFTQSGMGWSCLNRRGFP